ncbi:MAG: hypothetical protein P1U61_02210 [Legionellaceae bacterium]|nr:hypothetical protein [Legionellaceae bacterium]
MATNRVESGASSGADMQQLTRRRQKAIQKIEQNKQRIQRAARALTRIYLKDNPHLTPTEKAQLEAPLLGDNASVYHKPITLEGRLRQSPKKRVQKCLSELQRARNTLHYTMDRHFPRVKPENQDLLWALGSALVAALFAPLVLVSPFFLLVLMAPPLFFIGRKMYRLFQHAPYDFSLHTAGVTREEQQDVATLDENGESSKPLPRVQQPQVDVQRPEFTPEQAGALIFLKQNRSFFHSMHGSVEQRKVFDMFYEEQGATELLNAFYRELGPCVYLSENLASQGGKAFQVGDFDAAVKDSKIVQFMREHRDDAVVRLWKERGGQTYLVTHFTSSSSGDADEANSEFTVEHR